MQLFKNRRNLYLKPIVFEVLRKQALKHNLLAFARTTYTAQQDFLPDANDGAFWDDKFLDDQDFFPMERWRTQTIVRLLDCNKSILNLGVGRGKLEKLLLQKCPEPDYLGTDITNETINLLRLEMSELKFRKLHPLELDPDNHSFNQILLLEVLEHITPNKTFTLLRHIHRLLAAEGTFFISVPVNEGLEHMLPTNPNSHMRLYSKALLQFELEEVGFTVEKVFQAAAFNSFFTIKHFINDLIGLRSPNNILFICQKN